jgi:hypothetical protein
LFGRQCLYQTKQSGAALHFFNFHRTDLDGIDESRIVGDFAPGTLPAVGNQIGRDAKQPRRKRNPTPLKTFEIRQSLMKYFGRKVFGFCPIPYPLHNVSVDAPKVNLVELRKAGRVVLRSFNEKPLVRFFLQSLQRILRGFVFHLG